MHGRVFLPTLSREFRRQAIQMQIRLLPGLVHKHRSVEHYRSTGLFDA